MITVLKANSAEHGVPYDCTFWNKPFSSTKQKAHFNHMFAYKLKRKCTLTDIYITTIITVKN